jgi:hypothetical protein
MRTLRLSLVGTVILALVAGLGGATVAQEDAQGNTGFTKKDVECSPDWMVCQVEATDPRLSGTWTRVENCEENVSPRFEVCTGSVRVENEGGTWLGRSWLSAAITPPHFVAWFVLEGQGDYAGWTAYMYWDEEKHGQDPDVNNVGTIFDFELPFPELPAEE